MNLFQNVEYEQEDSFCEATSKHIDCIFSVLLSSSQRYVCVFLCLFLCGTTLMSYLAFIHLI